MKKYEARFFQCAACGFLQAENPHWLQEAYAEPITTADTGILQRNAFLTKVGAAMFWHLFRGKGKYLDAAGGYGLYTRMMRDVGFDYFWWDPHSPNLVARGFEGGSHDAPYTALTAFEVLEHVEDPVQFLGNLMATMNSRTILVSTDLIPVAAPPAPDWWYYAFDTGQHISFHTRASLEVIGQKLGLRSYSNRNIHLWTDRRLSRAFFRLMSSPVSATAFALIPRVRLESRVWPDHARMLKS